MKAQYYLILLVVQKLESSLSFLIRIKHISIDSTLRKVLEICEGLQN